MNEFDSEPVRGLPEHLPPGERILWQGAPRWRSLWRRLFRVRMIAVYFAILMVWRFAANTSDGATTAEALVAAAVLVPVLAAALALFALLAWAIARTTVYTITSRRLVLRFGVALPMSINLPFDVVTAADLKTYADGTGDISVALRGGHRCGYAVLWPHARPWRFGRPEPTLRCIPEAARVADVLSRALSEPRRQSEQTDATAGDAAEPATSADAPLAAAAR